MLVARALKIGQIADGGMPPTYETMHLDRDQKEPGGFDQNSVFMVRWRARLTRRKHALEYHSVRPSAKSTSIAMKEGTSAASFAICIRSASEDFDKIRSLTFILLR
jgi:hypothetical protein